MGTLVLIYGVLKSVASVVGSILKAVPPVIWLCLLCFAIGLCWTGKGCSRPSLFPVREKRESISTYEVIGVANGATVRVAYRVFERRTKLMKLIGIEAPIEGNKHFVFSGDNLRRYAGKYIWTKSGSNEVYGETGICLQLAQIRSGSAICQPDAPKEWKKAEALAKKNKFGIWSKN